MQGVAFFLKIIAIMIEKDPGIFHGHQLRSLVIEDCPNRHLVYSISILEKKTFAEFFANKLYLYIYFIPQID